MSDLNPICSESLFMLCGFVRCLDTSPLSSLQTQIPQHRHFCLTPLSMAELAELVNHGQEGEIQIPKAEANLQCRVQETAAIKTGS